MTEMVDCLLNGKWALKLPKHRAERPQWTQPPYWEPERLDHMHEHIKPGDVVFDIGAEEGDIPGLIASWVTKVQCPECLKLSDPYEWNDSEVKLYNGRNCVSDSCSEPARDCPKCGVAMSHLAFDVRSPANVRGQEDRNGGVVLFEPNPLVWPNIKAIWEANKLSPPWGCFVGFAGNEERKPKRPLDGTGWILGTWPQCADGAVIGNHGFCNLMERPDIPATTVDNTPIVPTALTIDTEGSELYVLQGAEKTLRECGPKVWVSSHPTFQQEMYGYDEPRLLAFLDAVGYRYELIAEDHEHHFFAEPK